MINELLEKLGLSDKEITLYLAVLQNGRISIPKVAKATGINRTTIYGLAEDLADRGFIHQDLGGRPNMLVAVPPENLRSIAQRQKNLIENLIPELHSISKETPFSVPKIKFVPEVDLEEYLYSEADRWDESMGEVDSTLWGLQDPTFAPRFKKWINWYNERPHTKEFKQRIITNTKEEGLPDFESRKVMCLGQEFDFNSAIWVRGHYIVMVSYKEEPNYLIEIYDKRMAHNLREMFRGFWSRYGNEESH